MESNPHLSAILKAAEELTLEGRKVTGFALQSKLGGGDPVEIKKLLDGHEKKELAGQVSNFTVMPLDDIPMLSQEALPDFQEELNKEREKNTELMKRLGQLVFEQKSLLQRYEVAESQRMRSEATLQDASATIQDLELQLKYQAEKSKQLIERHEALSRRHEKIKDIYIAQMIKLQKQIDLFSNAVRDDNNSDAQPFSKVSDMDSVNAKPAEFTLEKRGFGLPS